jgi:hypothetical protein
MTQKFLATPLCKVFSISYIILVKLYDVHAQFLFHQIDYFELYAIEIQQLFIYNLYKNSKKKNKRIYFVINLC